MSVQKKEQEKKEDPNKEIKLLKAENNKLKKENDKIKKQIMKLQDTTDITDFKINSEEEVGEAIFYLDADNNLIYICLLDI